LSSDLWIVIRSTFLLCFITVLRVYDTIRPSTNWLKHQFEVTGLVRGRRRSTETWGNASWFGDVEIDHPSLLQYNIIAGSIWAESRAIVELEPRMTHDRSDRSFWCVTIVLANECEHPRVRADQSRSHGGSNNNTKIYYRGRRHASRASASHSQHWLCVGDFALTFFSSSSSRNDLATALH
jgi:hypothetical protein